MARPEPGVIFRKHRAGVDLLHALAEERKACVRDILGRYNERQFVALRVEFIRRARAAGIGSIIIGKILGRNHTTVLYHMNGWRERKYAWAAARRALSNG